MLKRRLILALTINDGQLCRTKRFVPDRTYSMEFVDLNGADELVVLDVTKRPTSDSTRKFIGVIEKLSRELFLPLAVGGHIRSWDYARDLMNAGADKIIVGEGALGDRFLMACLVGRLGRQSVCGGIEPASAYHAAMWAVLADAVGCGEILLQDRERDGSLEGYRLGAVVAASAIVNIPVIAMSGCGTAQHMVEGFEAGAMACATSNIFHFTPAHVAGFKKHIEGCGFPMRTECDGLYGIS